MKRCELVDAKGLLATGGAIKWTNKQLITILETTNQRPADEEFFVFGTGRTQHILVRAAALAEESGLEAKVIQLTADLEDLTEMVLDLQGRVANAESPEAEPKVEEAVPETAKAPCPTILIAGGDRRVIPWLLPLKTRANFRFLHSGGMSGDSTHHYTSVPSADVAFILTRWCGHSMGDALKRAGRPYHLVPGGRSTLLAEVTRWLDTTQGGNQV
jgi:hypothetical protein